MVYARHPAFDWPGDETVLWRYMDFGRFVSILSNRSLFFCRIDKQAGDTWEGVLPPTQHQAIKQAIEKTWNDQAATFKQAAENARLRGDSEGEKSALQGQQIFESRNGRSLLDVYREERSWNGINCWHESQYESAAMWGLYAQQGQGIAIKTTALGLARCFEGQSEDVYIGRVRYIDYDRDQIATDNGLRASMCKRRSFEFEREVRALIARSVAGAMSMHSDRHPLPWPNPGENIPVDLEALIDEVRVSPRAPAWYVPLVDDLLRVYGLNRPLGRSDLDRDPVF